MLVTVDGTDTTRNRNAHTPSEQQAVLEMKGIGKALLALFGTYAYKPGSLGKATRAF